MNQPREHRREPSRQSRETSRSEATDVHVLIAFVFKWLLVSAVIAASIIAALALLP